MVAAGVRVTPGDGVKAAPGLTVAGVKIAWLGLVKEVSASAVSQRSLRSPVVTAVLHISLTSSSGWSLFLSCPARKSWLGCRVETDLWTW